MINLVKMKKKWIISEGKCCPSGERYDSTSEKCYKISIDNCYEYDSNAKTCKVSDYNL